MKSCSLEPASPLHMRKLCGNVYTHTHTHTHTHAHIHKRSCVIFAHGGRAWFEARKAGWRGLVRKVTWWREKVQNTAGQGSLGLWVQMTRYRYHTSKRRSFDRSNCTFIVDRRHGEHRNSLILLTSIHLLFIHVMPLDHHDTLYVTRPGPSPAFQCLTHITTVSRAGSSMEV